MFPSSEFLFNDRRTLHEQRFARLQTLKTSYIQLFINIFFLLLIIGISINIKILSPWNDLCSLHFCQVIFWAVSLIFHYLYVREHWYLKIKGHFKFYKTVKNYTNYMISTPAFFNVIVIIIIGVSNKYNLNNVEYLKLQHYITGGVLTLQLIITLCVTLAYIVTIHKFNKTKPVPDTEHNDYFLLSDAACSSEIGYRTGMVLILVQVGDCDKDPLSSPWETAYDEGVLFMLGGKLKFWTILKALKCAKVVPSWVSRVREALITKFGRKIPNRRSRIVVIPNPGPRLDGEAVADLLEKQADLIYYLKSAITEMNNIFINRS